MLLTILFLCTSATILKLPGAIRNRRSIIVHPESLRLNIVTVYNPVEAQCDSDPLITASNKRIDTKELSAGKIRWMALSRDLLKRWGGSLHYGDTVVLSAGDDEIDGLWVIQDTMNKRFRNRGDLLFDASTRSRGKWRNVTITPQKSLSRDSLLTAAR